MHTGRLRGLGRLAYLQTLALRVPRSHPPAHAHARHSTSNGSSLGSQTARHQVRISCKHLIYSDRLLRSSRSKLQHLQAISIHTGDPSIEQEEASFPIQKQSSIFSMRDVGERPTRDDLEKIAKSLGIHIRPDAKDDYVGALEGIHAAAEAVMAEPDFIPQADRKTYPRRDIHLPPKEELRQGWGYKATVEKHPPVDQGLLKGKTVVVKDTVMVADVPTLFGREVAGEYIATFDATAVKRILDAGGIITGKANCENWAWTYLSCLSPLSVIDNPLAPGFSAGGSSSGSAALIAGGHADLAIGGDQTGSLRVPASHCGLVGLKPTYGLVPATGVIAFEPEKEIIGPMGRTVRDCAALLEAIAGKDHIDLRYTDGQYPDPIPRYVDALAASRRSNVSENRLKGIKIGILEEGFNGPGADPEICRIVKCAIRKFEALGAETSDKTCHGYVEAAQTLLVGTQVSAVATLKGQATGTKMLKLGSYFEKFLPWSSEALDRAPEVIKISMVQAEYLASNFPTAYDRSVNLVRRLSLSIDELLEEVDVIAMPTCVVRPRRHVPADAPLSRFSEAGAHMGVNTTPFSATTHPALTIPVGYTPPLDDDIEQPSDKDIKLPVGLQLVGRKYGELELLKVADAWEQAYGRGSLDAGPKNVKLPGTETDL